MFILFLPRIVPTFPTTPGTSAYLQTKLADLNRKQKEIVDVYRNYLEDTSTNSQIHSPPPIVLLTGKGGTGKSFVIDTLLNIGNIPGRPDFVWTLAAHKFEDHINTINHSHVDEYITYCPDVVSLSLH